MFTDHSGRPGKKIVTWQEEDEWPALEGYESRSPQLVELRVVAMVFQCFPHIPLNFVTNSAYVAGIT